MVTTITKNGGVMMDDPQSIERFRLIALKSALKLEALGFKVHRNVNARKMAKQLTGLKTNDYTKLITAVEGLIVEQTKKVEFIHDDDRHGQDGNEGHG